MGLTKIALIVGGVLLGVGAVGGITAGLVTRQNSNTSVVDASKQNEKKPRNESSSTTETLETVARRINSNMIVVNDSQKENAQKEYYAFNVDVANLKVAKAAMIPQDFFVTISLVKQKNTIVTLNKGELLIRVKLSDSNNNSKNIDLTLNGFKKVDETLLNLFDRKTDPENSQEIDNSYSLTFTTKKDKANQFTTLEALNKVENNKQAAWNELISYSTTQDNEAKAFSIEAKTKVSKLEKIGNSTYFVLTSVDENKPIKLVKTEENNRLEALVGQIKINNLLATDITLVPNEMSYKNNSSYIEELKKAGSEGKKYLTTNTDEKLNRVLSVNVPNMPQDSTSSSQVFIKPYLLDVMGDDQIDVLFNLKVSFGKDDYLTTFKTSDNSVAMMLQDAGFKFGVYSKKLDDTNKAIEAEKITASANKLEAYFKDENYKMPVMITDKSMTQKNGMFSYKEVSNNFNEALKLKVKKQEMPQNWILFAEYSYLTEARQNPFENKTLFTPSISLIHLETKQN